MNLNLKKQPSIELDLDQAQIDLFPSSCEMQFASSDSLDLMLPQFHIQSEDQKELLQSELRIVKHLRQLGIKMKTDPLRKREQYYDQQKEMSKICLISSNMLDNFEFIQCDSEKNIEFQNTFSKEKVENFLASTVAESSVPSPGFTLNNNPLIQRRQSKNNSTSQQHGSLDVQLISNNYFYQLDDAILNIEFNNGKDHKSLQFS